MTKWSKTPPEADGWLWIKFRNKWGGTSKKPAELGVLSDSRTLRCGNILWLDNGKGFVDFDKVDKTLRFGPAIEEPK